VGSILSIKTERYNYHIVGKFNESYKIYTKLKPAALFHCSPYGCLIAYVEVEEAVLHWSGKSVKHAQLLSFQLSILIYYSKLN